MTVEAETNEVVACPNPECQSTVIRPRSTHGDWYCTRCQLRFDEPERRPSAGTNGSGQSLSAGARILWDADPSEYP